MIDGQNDFDSQLLHERKERHFCRPPTHFLSRMLSRFLRKQQRFCHLRHKLRCGFRNFQLTVSTGHAHSALKETGFKYQSVSTTNLLDGYIKERVQAGRDLSLSLFPLIVFSRRERTPRAGKERGHRLC